MCRNVVAFVLIVSAVQLTGCMLAQNNGVLLALTRLAEGQLYHVKYVGNQQKMAERGHCCG